MTGPLDGPRRDWATGKAYKRPGVASINPPPADAMSEESKALLAEHTASMEAPAVDTTHNGQVLDAMIGNATSPEARAQLRFERMSPAEQYRERLRREQLASDAVIAEQARYQFRQSLVPDLHSDPVVDYADEDFVEGDFGADDERESVYQAIDSAVDSWTEEDVAEYERLKAEQGAVSAYQHAQEDAA
jgi:hypothetical protein